MVFWIDLILKVTKIFCKDKRSDVNKDSIFHSYPIKIRKRPSIAAGNNRCVKRKLQNFNGRCASNL